MFIVDGMSITMTSGDTGAITFTFEGYTFTENDAVLFTIKTGSGATMIAREYHPDANNQILVCFFNNETEGYPAGTYLWDVRVVIGAYRDASGTIVDGDQVITPYTPQTLTLLNPVTFV